MSRRTTYTRGPSHYKIGTDLPDETAFMIDPARGCKPGNVVDGFEINPEWFFSDNQTDRAKRICNRHCPVRVACDAYATSHGERWGVWGGKNRNTRKANWDI